MGDQRGLGRRIERMLEDGVGDVFARVFGGPVVPAELEALLRREASDSVRRLAGDRLLAPNDYLITLSAPDHLRLQSDGTIGTKAFAAHLAGYIHDQGWQTYGEVVVRLEQSESLHTGQYRARALVNPDARADGDPEADPRRSAAAAAPGESKDAYTAESGVPAMTDTPGYRGGQGQDRPGDEYYDDQYGRPQEDPRAAAPDQQGGQYPADQGYYQQGYPPNYQQGYPPNYPPNYQQGYPPRPAYPEQGGYPDQGYGPGPGHGGPGYDQRPPAQPYGGPGYDQGYRPAPGYGQPPYGPPPGGDYGDYGRPRYDEPGYGRPEPRPAYPDPQPGYPPQTGQPQYGQPEYGQPQYGQPEYGQQPPYGGYDPSGYAPPAPSGYEYGEYGQAAPAGPAEYSAPAFSATLQLDDGSGRTYQLQEGANVIGRGQDAQFRLPDTGVSRRHLEIRWDGQVALLSDLNSTNGTTVNNAPVQEWQLADGDVIRVGHSEIIVRLR